MSHLIARKGQTYPSTPRIINRTVVRFTPVYATSNGDGAIGNGTFVGTWELDGIDMRLKLALIFGTTTTIGTGEVLLPLPPGWTSQMIAIFKMPEVGPFNVEQYAGGTKNSTTPFGVTIHVNNFVDHLATLNGFLAAMAGAAPGDIFQIAVDVPFDTFGPT